ITRIGAAYEAAGREEDAIRTYRRAMSRVGRSYYLRKELISRVVDIYRRRQGLDELAREYEKQWPTKRRGHLEWDVLARLYEETGAQEKAISAYLRATAKAPYELDTQRRLIALLENSGREDEALKQYEAVIRVAPGEPRFQLELAERYWRRGKDKQALSLLAKMERRFPTDASVHSAIADLYTRWGKTELALKAHVRLTRIEPNDITHLLNLGEQYFQRNQKKKAISVWKKIIARKSAANYARLGQVYAEHDLLSDSLAMYRQAIRMAPKKAEYYRGRASVYERRRTFDQAIADWEKVLELTPKSDANKPARREARRRVVNLLKRARSSRLYRRVQAWKSAFRQDPPDIEAGYFLVEAYLRDRKYGDARTTLERLLTINPKDIEAMQQLVKVYKRELNYDKAVELLERLADLSPSRKREYYSEIAEIKTDQRRDDEAIEWITKAVESSPKDPIAHQRLAERYVEMQAFAKAITAYEKTIELDKRNYRVYFDLARLYTYVNAPDKARTLYREILRRASDEPVLRRAGDEAIALE
ncbi:MAG: tetratricopeptide repeat protein, partial [Myxococcota bacterium]